jgi:hypothetical protein
MFESEPPRPPPVDVIDENTESEPEVGKAAPALSLNPPVPPPPTVTV